MTRPSILAQIEELRGLHNALANGRNPYAGLRQGEIDYRLGRLGAAIGSLEWCRTHADLIRAVHEQVKRQEGQS